MKTEKLRRYVLPGRDANRDDPSLANEIYFDIYRDGKRIATTRSTRYEDYDYVSGAGVSCGRSPGYTTIRRMGLPPS